MTSGLDEVARVAGVTAIKSDNLRLDSRYAPQCHWCQQVIDEVTVVYLWRCYHPRCYQEARARAVITPLDTELPFAHGPCVYCGRLVRGGGPYRVVYCWWGCAAARRNERQRVRHDPRRCDHCGEVFTPARSDARYCCTAHRVAAHRKRKTGDG